MLCQGVHQRSESDGAAKASGGVGGSREGSSHADVSATPRITPKYLFQRGGAVKMGKKIAENQRSGGGWRD